LGAFSIQNEKIKLSEIVKKNKMPQLLNVSEAPPAERVASGSPPEGGVYIGKAPLGLLVIKI
jgi:hypothetical protein